MTNRQRAWETRRAKYGQRGHSGTYSRFKSGTGQVKRMQDALIQLHREEVLSEGQVAKIIGCGRVEVRRLVDGVIE
ncbi:hypothetical protein COO92_21425 [Thalassospira lohafexi]|uniref:Uncharacterized protein n=1 Tax=Thalassospira lohafexi TaxID=744227 RepID=A0A2N3L0N6_9PROT|nr:hypothetical protein COO92_21425 [Thalassospira lohafexi]